MNSQLLNAWIWDDGWHLDGTALKLFYNTFSQFVSQLQLYFQLLLSLQFHPIAFGVPISTWFGLVTIRCDGNLPEIRKTKISKKCYSPYSKAIVKVMMVMVMVVVVVMLVVVAVVVDKQRATITTINTTTTANTTNTITNHTNPKLDTRISFVLRMYVCV